MSWMLSICSECNKIEETNYYPCTQCKKSTICANCINLTYEETVTTLCNDCNKHYLLEQKKKRYEKQCYEKPCNEHQNIHRTYEYRNSILHSIQTSYFYRGIRNDPSIAELDVVLDDYLKNGTPYINKEIAIIDNHKITSSHNPPGTKYKMVINLYNDSTKGDAFSIEANVFTPSHI